MAYNNTYSIKAINQTAYDAAVTGFTRAGGVRGMITKCLTLAADYDPTNQGNNATVNKACSAAADARAELESPYTEFSGRAYYDISQLNPDPFPFSYYYGYLNQPHVQSALGARVNFSSPSLAAASEFQLVGDFPRGGYLADLSALIDAGVKVSLVYGDRDYACNWLGGEAVSLAINYSHSTNFARAGYANMTTNSSYVGGLVRQHGNFSFTRVFQVGHEVPAYQPETAYEIFRRAMFNLDIATGKQDTARNASYSTLGLSDTFSVKNIAPKSQPPICYLCNALSTCTDDQLSALANGSAVLRDYVLIDNDTSSLFR